MLSSFLLPARYKKIGWWILLPATAAGIFLAISGFDAHWLPGRVFALFADDLFHKQQAPGWVAADLSNTLVGVCFLLGALLVGFSREKREDEFIARIRLSSLLWAVWINYLLLLLAFLFVYGLAFLNVMIYNMFTVLILFILRFNFVLYRSKKNMPDEK